MNTYRIANQAIVKKIAVNSSQVKHAEFCENLPQADLLKEAAAQALHGIMKFKDTTPFLSSHLTIQNQPPLSSHFQPLSPF
jgi:hypothetical protein